ncbi:MAG TPA: PAS domain S-box protein [Terriglobales bacterium]|nr:PAS domain S-box protein [Terriglobales bacterium]
MNGSPLFLTDLVTNVCDPRILRRLNQFVSCCCALAILFGLWVLTGWMFHLTWMKSIVPGQVAVKANAATCFIFLGLALWILRKEDSPIAPAWRLAAKAAAFIAGVVGLLSLLEYAAGLDLGIDQLLFTPGPKDIPGSVRPGLMSPLAAFGFFGLGSTLLLLDVKSKLARWPAQLLPCVVAIAAMFGIMDFVLDPITTHTYISPVTASILFLFSFGLMFARADWGLGALVAGVTQGGTLTRRLLPAAILVPLVIGWLRWNGQNIGLYSNWTGVSLMTVISILLLSGLTALSGFTLARNERERQRGQETVDRLAAMVECSDVAIIGKTTDGVVTSWNPAAEAIYGYSAREIVGKSISTVIPANRREEFDTILEKIRRGQRISHYETTRVRKDGQAVSVSLSVSPVKDKAGNLVGVSTIARDITERKRAEEELQLSRERLALAQKAAHSGTFDWDIQNNVNHWSPEVEEVHGIAPGKFGGTYEDWEALVVPEDLVVAKKGIEESLKTGEFAGEWRIRRRNDGEIRWITARAKVVFDDNGKPQRMLGLNMDVTARKRAEEEVRRLNRELEQRVIQRTAQLEAANKELEAFTYSVSHDLRAPLRHISGFSKLLTEEYGSALAPEAKHHLQRIQEGTRRMGLLVDDLLNLGRIGRHELRLQITGLNSVVDETLFDLKEDCEGRQVEWKIGTLPFVECDPALMKQVFQNLLSNAVKFTHPRSQAVIEVGQKDEDGSAVVFVRDNGVGFNMKYADKLFGVFQRLHRPEDFEGTGVGLATVQRIIQKHGGRIWAEAELGKGATFFFTLGTSEKTELKTNAATAGDKA